MTDKDIVERAKEAEKRTGFGRLVHSSISKGVNSAFGIGFIEGMIEYRNSLQEEPISKDLEEAIGVYCSNPDNFATWIGGKENDDIPLIIKAIKFGAKWKEQQFEKNRLAACDKQTVEEATIEFDFAIGIIKNEHRKPTFDDAIKYGMRLQKEQMMANAVDGFVTPYFYGTDGKTYGCIAQNPFCLEDMGLKDTDKVKVIVIKED